MPRPLPGVRVFGITRRQHPYPASRTQQRQRLDRRLGARHRQQLAGAIIRTGSLFQAVLGLWQAGPGISGYRRNREWPGRDATGQVQPLLARDTVMLHRTQQAATVFKH
ncbi:hypothetical protein D3C81_1593310 [compost metagenome]